jgi:hypothetical protein
VNLQTDAVARQQENVQIVRHHQVAIISRRMAATQMHVLWPNVLPTVTMVFIMLVVMERLQMELVWHVRPFQMGTFSLAMEIWRMHVAWKCVILLVPWVNSATDVTVKLYLASVSLARRQKAPIILLPMVD